MAEVIPFTPAAVRAPADDDMAITRACPFCGERENLFLGEEEKHLAVDAAGKPILMEIIPTVFCDVCDASAPLDTWNGQFLSPEGA